MEPPHLCRHPQNSMTGRLFHPQPPQRRTQQRSCLSPQSSQPGQGGTRPIRPAQDQSRVGRRHHSDQAHTSTRRLQSLSWLQRVPGSQEAGLSRAKEPPPGAQGQSSTNHRARDQPPWRVRRPGHPARAWPSPWFANAALILCQPTKAAFLNLSVPTRSPVNLPSHGVSRQSGL